MFNVCWWLVNVNYTFNGWSYHLVNSFLFSNLFNGLKKKYTWVNHYLTDFNRNQKRNREKRGKYVNKDGACRGVNLVSNNQRILMPYDRIINTCHFNVDVLTSIMTAVQA
jgi:hypothetical protein